MLAYTKVAASTMQMVELENHYEEPVTDAHAKSIKQESLRRTCAHAQICHSRLCSPTQILGFPTCKELN